MFPLWLSSELLDFADSSLLPVSFSLALPELLIIAAISLMQAHHHRLSGLSRHHKEHDIHLYLVTANNVGW